MTYVDQNNEHDARQDVMTEQARARDKFWSRSNLGEAHVSVSQDGKTCLLQIEGGGSLECTMEQARHMYALLRKTEDYPRD